MCEANCTSIRGIRIYYGRYPSITASNKLTFPSLSNVDPMYGNLHTVFMVPTYGLNGVNVDFPMPPAGALGCPTQIITNANYKMPAIILALSPTGRNHGELCPPLCGGSFFITE
jgi:hypothetical protein